MQTRNILTAALLICLSSTLYSAPVEETEVEEQEAMEEVEEEELSEEEDDDDSKSLDSIMGTGAHAGSSPSRGPGASSAPGAGAQRPSDHVVFPSGSSLLLEASDNNARAQVQEGQNVSSLGSAASGMVSDTGPPPSETSPLASTPPPSSPTNPRSPAPGDSTLAVYLTFNQSNHPASTPDAPSSAPDQSPSTSDHPSSTLGESPSTLGESPSTLGQSPSTLGQSPSTLGQSPSTLGQSPSTLEPGYSAVNTASDHAPSVGQQESQSTTVSAREQPGNGRQTLLADTGRGSSVAMATVVDGNRGNQVQTGTAAYQMDLETVMVEVSSPPPGTATSFSDVTGGTESSAVERLSHSLSASLLPADTVTMATALSTHTDQQTATHQMLTAASAAERLHPPGPGTQGAEDVELEDSC